MWTATATLSTGRGEGTSKKIRKQKKLREGGPKSLAGAGRTRRARVPRADSPRGLINSDKFGYL
eukprot:940860-Prorocentrum_minimum.AAC.1